MEGSMSKLAVICVLASGCNVMSLVKKPSSTTTTASAPASPTTVAQVETTPEDPSSIRNAAADLDKLAHALETQDLRSALAAHHDAANNILRPDPEDAASPKYPKLQARLSGLEVQLAAAIGGHVAQVIGDGKRSPDASSDAVEVMTQAIDECRRSYSHNSVDPESYQKYEKKLAKALKIDPKVVHLSNRESSIDVQSQLIDCEYAYMIGSLDAGDDPPHENYDKAAGETYTGCGERDMVLNAPQMGNRFAAYEAHEGYAQALECKQLVKRGSKLPGEVAAALRDSLKPGDIVVMKGKPYTMNDDDNLRLVKVVDIEIYNKKTELSKSPCGVADDTTVCEASGSHGATMYNHLSFYTERALAHKKAGRVDRCKALLQTAAHEFEHWHSDMDDMKKSGNWREGLKYKTRTGTLDQKTILAKIDELGAKADDNATGGFCAAK
jgi:hypothetical protein